MALRLVTDSTDEPVAIDEMKSHLRVSSTAEDSLIEGYIVAARKYAERVTGRAMMDQTWRLTRDDFPTADTLELEGVVPLSSTDVTVRYFPSSGGSTTVDGGEFYVDTEPEPGRVVLRSSGIWPSETLREKGGVQVDFEAGYGKSGNKVPRDLRQAVLLMAAHWYENREPVVIGSVGREVPMAAQSILKSYRHPVVAGTPDPPERV